MTDTTKLNELAERASSGAWSFSPCVADKHFLGQVWNGSGESLCIMDHMTDQANADGAYIAAANPQAILGLIAEVERLRKDAERYRWLRDLPEDSPYEEIGNYPGCWWDEEIDRAMSEAALEGVGNDQAAR